MFVGPRLLRNGAALIRRQAVNTIGLKVPNRTAVAMSSVDADVLVYKDDHYGGVIVDPESLPADCSAFTEKLLSSLKVWQDAHKRGVWLKVPIHKAALIALAVEHGSFKFHHAEEVGVGAFVLNERREVLMVQERLGPLRGKKIWKMPTGLVLAGEDFTLAAEREVLEETGVRAAFDDVLAIRQAHGFAFGKSDLFFLVALKPEPGQTEISPQESEIEAACWMPLEEFKTQGLAQSTPLYQRLIDRCVVYADGRSKCRFKAAELEAGFLGKQRTDLLLWLEEGEEGEKVPGGEVAEQTVTWTP